MERNGKRSLHGGEARDDEIETATIQALGSLQNTLYFEGLNSKTNDYNQTLAHFAALFRYFDLLRWLLGWNMNISVAEVNGFTALHCTYKRGDKACVELLPEKGVSETHLGEPLPTLMPKSFESGRDHDADMSSDGQFEAEKKLDILSDILSLHPRPSPAHGVSDVDDDKSVNNDEHICQVQSSWTHSHRRRKLLRLLDQFTNSSWRPKHFKQADPLSDCRASTRSLRPSLEHACRRHHEPAIHIRLPHQSFQIMAISPNQ